MDDGRENRREFAGLQRYPRLVFTPYHRAVIELAARKEARDLPNWASFGEAHLRDRSAFDASNTVAADGRGSQKRDIRDRTSRASLSP